MKYMVPANDGTVIECSTAIGGCLGVLSDRIRVAEAERRFSARKVKKKKPMLAARALDDIRKELRW